MQVSPNLQNPTPYIDSEATERPFEIQQLLALLFVGWPIIAATVLLALLAAVFYTFITPPSYETNALVQVEGDQNSARIALSQVTDQVTAELPVPTEMEILQSRMVLGQVVDHLKLDILAAPVFYPVVGQAIWRHHSGPDFGKPPLWLRPFALSKQSWGGESVRVTTLQLPPQLENQPLQLVYKGDDAYDLKLASGERLLSGTVGKLATTEWQGESLAMFVQSIKAAAGKEFSVRRVPAQSAIRALQGRLAIPAPKFSVNMITLKLTGPNPAETMDTLNEVLNVYQAQNLARRAEGAQQTLNFMRAQLPDLKAQVDSSEDKLNRFKVRQGTADLEQETSLILGRNVEIEKKIGDLQQQKKEIMQVYTANNPSVIGLDDQIGRLREELVKVNDRIKKLPDAQQEALSLMRDVQVSTSLYISLLNRTQELEVVKSGTVGNIRVIDRPFLPLHRKSPNRTQIALVGMAIGLLAGIAIILIGSALKNGVDDPDVLEKSLGIPTYGAIPYSDTEQLISKGIRENAKSNGILAVVDPGGAAMEALRSVRTALHFAQLDAANNILMLTGPEPGVGKSFLSINLAASLANAGKKVVVVDADLRLGHMHKYFELERKGGLSEVISGQMPLEQALRATKVQNLSVLTTGIIPPNPAELLINPLFVQLLNTLSKQFDHVILDTPPALAVADPAIIGRHVGITLLVLKAGKHPLRMIEETLKRLHTAGVPVRGTLFNQVGRGRHGKYGYYTGYFYRGYNYNAKAENTKA